jgi:hypothetical protein
VGVQRFRSLEEMNAAPIPRVSANAFERFIEHCELFRTLGRVEYQPGVRRFRTLEEAQRARLDRFQARRQATGDPE